MANARTVALAAGICICILAALPAMLVCSSASSSSSAEDGLDLEGAAVERCVRLATPALIADGTYEHQSKVDLCVNDGLNALEDGKAPSAAAAQMVDCINGKPFPADLQPTVDDLTACITAALP